MYSTDFSSEDGSFFRRHFLAVLFLYAAPYYLWILLTYLVLMALFCSAIKRDSVFLVRFSFLSHVPVFLYEISSVCRLKYPSLCSCRAASTDFPDPPSQPVSIIHRTRQVFQAISCIDTALLYIRSTCWSFNLCSSMWGVPQEYIPYEFVLTSPAVSRMYGSSNIDSFRDGL